MCFSTTLLLRLGFGTGDGRGSGTPYFRALVLRSPTPQLRMEEARPAGSVVSQTLWAQDSWASRATAARAAPESVESPAGEHWRPCASLRSRQGASSRRRARAAFFCGTQEVLEGFLSKKCVRSFKMHSINATQGGISCHSLSHIPFKIELVLFRSNSSFPPRSYGGQRQVVGGKSGRSCWCVTSKHLKAELARETPPLTPLQPVAASWETFAPCHFLQRRRSSANRSLGIKA